MSFKLTRNYKDPECAEYWRRADETAKKVAKWVKWKRDIKLGPNKNERR